MFAIINYYIMTVKEKIQQYLEYKGISPTSAERELQWGVGAFTKAKSISVDRAKEFLLYYTDLSSEWLLRDEGLMIKDEMLKNTFSKEQSNPITNERLFSIIESQQRTIENLTNK